MGYHNPEALIIFLSFRAAASGAGAKEAESRFCNTL